MYSTSSFDINEFYVLRARCIHVEWISEQRAIISRCGIKLIAFITETECDCICTVHVVKSHNF